MDWFDWMLAARIADNAKSPEPPLPLNYLLWFLFSPISWEGAALGIFAAYSLKPHDPFAQPLYPFIFGVVVFAVFCLVHKLAASRPSWRLALLAATAIFWFGLLCLILYAIVLPQYRGPYTLLWFGAVAALGAFLMTRLVRIDLDIMS